MSHRLQDIAEDPCPPTRRVRWISLSSSHLALRFETLHVIMATSATSHNEGGLVKGGGEGKDPPTVLELKSARGLS